MIKQRNEKLWQKIDQLQKETEAFLIINPKNIFYLSHFSGEGILLSVKDNYYLITDSRYTEQAHQETHLCQVIIQDMKQKDAQTVALKQLLTSLKIKYLGFEAESLPTHHFLKYQHSMPFLSLMPFYQLVESLRMIKDQNEIRKLSDSAKLATNAFMELLPDIKAGDTEIAISANLNYRMRQKGAQREAFELIVTSGERGTLIHGTPSQKSIDQNELIIIDFGCIFQMYHSDCTRSFVLNNPSQKQKKMFKAVYDAQAETLKQVKPGQKCSDLDSFTRNIITEHGYGNYFSHSLGHGVGLDIHELPRLSPYDETILQPGMVITVEPGIYIPNIGGIRIEDTVVVNENGCQILTQLPKKLLAVDYY